MTTERGLGRKEEFDEASRKYAVRQILDKVSRPRAISKEWECPVWLDQGQEGACAGFAWAHELAAGPDFVPNITNQEAQRIFQEAKTMDPWPGSDYDYTSVLAAAKATKKLYPHIIKSYHWAFGIDDVLHSLSHLGPVVLGVDWYTGMGIPDTENFIWNRGRKTGSHAILAIGIDVENKKIRLRNSWGKSWGKDGDCFMSFPVLERLLQERGEACTPIRNKQT